LPQHWQFWELPHPAPWLFFQSWIQTFKKQGFLGAFTPVSQADAACGLGVTQQFPQPSLCEQRPPFFKSWSHTLRKQGFLGQLAVSQAARFP
jgi:hypothetical protein